MFLKAKVWSNASFILPLILAVIFKIYPLALLLAVIILFSSMYHHALEEKFEVWDIIFAGFLFIADVYLCYLSGFKEPYFILALAFLISAVFFHLKSEEKHARGINHSLWHLLAAASTIFCILAYKV